MNTYKSVLLKLSGRFLNSREYIKNLAEVVKEVKRETSMAILVGGGNILRGRDFASKGRMRMTADLMGMYATVINGIFITEIFNETGIDTVHLSSLRGKYAEPYEPAIAMEYMGKKVVILSGGTGSPFFSTDTAAVLRGCELGVDVVIKGTDVDGVYSGDPKLNQAEKFSKITYKEIVSRELKVMDLTATALAWEFSLPIVVINMEKPENLKRVLKGENIGTFIGRENG